jgi:heme A synthase
MKKILSLVGTLGLIFAFAEYYALKANDWDFDLFETGLAFVVALIIWNFVRVAAKKNVRVSRFGLVVFLLVSALLLTSLLYVTRSADEVVYVLVEGFALSVVATFWLILCFRMIQSAYRRREKTDSPAHMML